MEMNRRKFLGLTVTTLAGGIARSLVPAAAVAAPVAAAAPVVAPVAVAAYGAGVRAQVFEVIVRQAMAGAPWKEICGGPMMVNAISAQEVQHEVDRRKSLLADVPAAPPSKA